MFTLKCSCDESGAMLAKRIDDPDFGRIISRHESEEQARTAMEHCIAFNASHNIPIGPGCYWIEHASSAGKES